ncbi:MAG TPA: VOC family protein [Candidatus Binatia bacterium]
MAIKIKRTGHLVLKVKELERSKRFFTEVLGLPVVGEAPKVGMLFFSPDVQANHHMLAIRQAPEGARTPEAEDIGMEHVAYELESFADLQEAYRIFKANDVKLRQVVFHGITKSIYFYDPDGNMLEVYCNVPPEEYRKTVKNPYGIYGDISAELDGTTPQKPGTVAP